MKVKGRHYRSLWADEAGRVHFIDQTSLPFEFRTGSIASVEETIECIRTMRVRGAPSIGATAAYGMYIAVSQGIDLPWAAQQLITARPTAFNLQHALQYMLDRCQPAPDDAAHALRMANDYADAEADRCRQIGLAGIEIIRDIFESTGKPVQIMTHCNAGWLACVDYGTALSPIYLAHREGIPVHVWVSETRPRNQGGRLTAWELGEEAVPHTLIADNAAGLLMMKGQVDMVIVGSDRTSSRGDVVNKVGTYLKALAAREHGIPFYVALPTSTIDMKADSLSGIVIEERRPDEVLYTEGWDGERVINVLTAPAATTALNPAFDITPPEMVTALITERGLCMPNADDIKRMMSDG